MDQTFAQGATAQGATARGATARGATAQGATKRLKTKANKSFQHLSKAGAALRWLALAIGLTYVSACGEDFREAGPKAPGTASEGQRRTPFKQGCLALLKKDKDDLLLKRLAKIADLVHPVCRKMSIRLEGLKTLDLSAATDAEQLTEASLIFTLKNLESLSLADNRLTDIQGIANLTGLMALDISGNRALGLVDETGESPDWEVVARLPLRQLNIAMTSTDSLAPFITLYFLEELDITGNAAITDLTPIARLENLKVLKATGIGLGTTTQASKDNCPTDARSPAVGEFCRNLIKDSTPKN